MTDVVFLGTCGNQTATAEAVAFVIAGDRNLLVDAGPGVVRQIYAADLRPIDIDAVFLTHAHADHVAGFAYFVWSRFYDCLGGASAADLAVLAPDHMIGGLRAMLDFSYDTTSFPFAIDWIPVPGGAVSSRKVAGMEVTTAPVLHSVPALGMRVRVPDGPVVAYSSDTLYCDAVVDLARDATLLIHEAFVTVDNEALSQKTRHATAREAGRVACEAGANRLCLVHYFPPLADNLDSLVAEAASEYSGAVSVPRELDRVSL